MNRTSLILLLSLLALLSAGAAESQIPIPPHEREALIALYHQTHGDEWADNTGWLGPPGTECTWYGIGCGCVVDTGGLCRSYVGTIDLSGDRLRGCLPRRIGALRRLDTLNLHLNHLECGIPKEIGSLRQLQYLDLSSNRITGTLPHELGSLSRLRYLDVGANRISGEIPHELGNLRRLELLTLGGNRLTGTIPAGLANLTNLDALLLGGNFLTGEIPPWLGSLTRLSTLILGGNRFTGTIPPELFKLPQLTWLSLGTNRLRGRIPREIGDSRFLTFLEMTGNRLQGPIPRSILDADHLVDVFLDWNALYPTNQEVKEFIDQRTRSPFWLSTQTLAPTGLMATATGSTSVRLRWTPVNFFPGSLNEAGGYLIYQSFSLHEPFAYEKTVRGKQTTTVEVAGLQPGTTYYFSVLAFSRPQEENANTVRSELSPPVSVTTLRN